ncbi:formylglycine-generating enzyme family protein [Paenibacillus sp. BC26]|uniref:formylglycine-generating enzyme family protein n=1 Tax=Paenibacillus sp. BC26 TaxID=1881032 RepID=UPI0008EA9B23|nr:Formylglycine-generating enzyme, required for sulfatase activity, contains SUMF1/FGE domain [Paenibacillus sp. BC26]
MAEQLKSCCCASRGDAAMEASAAEVPSERSESTDQRQQLPEPESGLASSAQADENMVLIPAGEFLMGTDDAEGFPQDGEGPIRNVKLDAFCISRYAVTNAQFAQFVAATGYLTEAEKFGWSYVFHLLASDATREAAAGAPQGTPWWLAVNGAYWAQPEGPDSTIAERAEHPVVHVSWNDAAAYCAWRGGRLPTEAEWEYAARGGLVQRRYPWGDLLKPDTEHLCNIWQGKFPVKNNASDGYHGTAPVDAYKPNGYGLYNMSGNVWEWCSDWFTPQYHRVTSAVSPHYTKPTHARSMRGGSYLCHKSYCNRYRVAARNSNTPDSSTGNCGFRIVKAVGVGEEAGGGGHRQ